MTGTDKSSIALKWITPESDGNSPIFNYVVEFRPESSTQWKRANESVTVPDSTFSVTGLKEGKEYVFRVSAENKVGVGEPSKPTKPIKVVEPNGKKATKVIQLIIYFTKILLYDTSNPTFI